MGNLQSVIGETAATYVKTLFAFLAGLALVQLVHSNLSRSPMATRPTQHDRGEPFPDEDADNINYADPDEDYFQVTEFEPSPADVVVVKIMLQKALQLPPELAETIIEMAQYWPHNETVIDYRSLLGSHLIITSSRSGSNNKLLIRTAPIGFKSGVVLTKNARYTDLTLPLKLPGDELNPKELRNIVRGPHPSLEHPVRKIVFRIRSHDQGWGGDPEDHDTFNGSWTWFDAGLERFGAQQHCPNPCEVDKRSRMTPGSRPLKLCTLRSVWPEMVTNDNDEPCMHHPMGPEPDRRIQCNRVANRNFADYTVVWDERDSVKNLPGGIQGLLDVGRGAGTGDGAFVRGLRMGDVVTVWGKSRFPGWANHVQMVGVKIYWAL